MPIEKISNLYIIIAYTNPEDSIMSNCLICAKNIDATNNSKEHIIPNAIGGSDIVEFFLCEKCNNEAGENWDSELSNQLATYCLLLGIKRCRGETPAQIHTTVSGESYLIRPNGRMTISKPTPPEIIDDIVSGTKKITFSARDTSEARRMLSGLKRKHPSLSVDEAMSTLKNVETYLNGDPLHFEGSFGGIAVGKSIIKTLLAFGHYNNVSYETMNLAIDFIRDNAEPCYGFYYDKKDIITDRIFTQPAHALAIQSFPERKKVIGYIEYFGVLRVLACLSDNYEGEEFKHSYYVYPENWTKGKIDFDLSISANDITEAYSLNKYDPEILKNALTFFLSYVHSKDTNREDQRVLKRVEEILTEKYNPDATEKELWDLTKDVTDSLMPYILSRTQRNRKK
ncbi:HNH endonuclease [Pantoea agglomerans]|uniref:HNH endonuclease n=2 Tax=Enterobacter agglomerans TaxID=549 RepID=UPI003207DD2A